MQVKGRVHGSSPGSGAAGGMGCGRVEAQVQQRIIGGIGSAAFMRRREPGGPRLARKIFQRVCAMNFFCGYSLRAGLIRQGAGVRPGVSGAGSVQMVQAGFHGAQQHPQLRVLVA